MWTHLCCFPLRRQSCPRCQKRLATITRTGGGVRHFWQLSFLYGQIYGTSKTEFRALFLVSHLLLLIATVAEQIGLLLPPEHMLIVQPLSKMIFFSLRYFWQCYLVSQRAIREESILVLESMHHFGLSEGRSRMCLLVWVFCSGVNCPQEWYLAHLWNHGSLGCDWRLYLSMGEVQDAWQQYKLPQLWPEEATSWLVVQSP